MRASSHMQISLFIIKLNYLHNSIMDTSDLGICLLKKMWSWSLWYMKGLSAPGVDRIVYKQSMKERKSDIYI